MLRHPDQKWRTLNKLSTVVGADEDTTKRLLLEIGARASEKGDGKWGLLRRVPFGHEE